MCRKNVSARAIGQAPIGCFKGCIESTTKGKLGPISLRQRGFANHATVRKSRRCHCFAHFRALTRPSADVTTCSSLPTGT